MFLRHLVYVRLAICWTWHSAYSGRIFTAIVPDPWYPPSGEINTRGVTGYSDFRHIERYIAESETVQDDDGVSLRNDVPVPGMSSSGRLASSIAWQMAGCKTKNNKSTIFYSSKMLNMTTLPTLPVPEIDLSMILKVPVLKSIYAQAHQSSLIRLRACVCVNCQHHWLDLTWLD